MRRENRFESERVTLVVDHAATSDDLSIKTYKVPAGRSLKLVRAMYVNPTGLAAHNDNWFDISVKKGSTKMCAWSTDGNGTGINGAAAEGTIAADTFVELTKSSTAANLVAQAGDVLSLVLDETGTATLPAGKLVLEGILV